MSEMLNDARRSLRAVRDGMEGRFHRAPLTAEDELELAEQYDRDRGFDRPLYERSKEAREQAAHAPLLRWTPPALRHRV